MRWIALYVCCLFLAQLVMPLLSRHGCCPGDQPAATLHCDGHAEREHLTCQLPSERPEEPEKGHSPCSTGCSCACCGARVVLWAQGPDFQPQQVIQEIPSRPSSAHDSGFAHFIWHPPKA